MFNIGSRVQILASNQTKAASPRVGSIGYFAGLSSPHYYKDISVLAVSCRIMFVQYGNEENSRLEFKNVIAVVPVVFNKEEQKARTLKTIQRVSKGITEKDSWQHRLYESGYNNKKTPVVVLAPAKPIDFMTKDHNQYLGWLISWLKTETQSAFLRSRLKSDILFHRSNLDKGLLYYITDIAYDGEKMSQVTSLPDSAVREAVISHKTEIIQVLRMITAIHSRFIKESYRMQVGEALSNVPGRPVQKSHTEALTCLLTGVMFRDNIYELVADALFEAEINWEENNGPLKRGREPLIHEIIDSVNYSKECITNMII